LAEGAAFCGRCGSPVAAAPGVPPPPPPPLPPQQQAAEGMTPNVAALLSYILGFITGILFLVLEPYKNNRFVRFHAFQSIFFSVALMAFWILWNTIFFSLGFISGGFLWSILGLISTLIGLAAFLYWLFLMYKAYNNERYMIPVLGDLAAKQAG
jgi:uncharacterized membrane protein